MAWRAKGRHEARTDRRSPYTTEILLVVHVHEVADGEAAADEGDGERLAIAVRVQKADDVGREAVRLRVDLGEVSIPVVLHHDEELVDLFLDCRQRRLRVGPADSILPGQVGVVVQPAPGNEL